MSPISLSAVLRKKMVGLLVHERDIGRAIREFSLQLLQFRKPVGMLFNEDVSVKTRVHLKGNLGRAIRKLRSVWLRQIK